MIIKFQPDAKTTFEDLKDGEAFRYNDSVYIRIVAIHDNNDLINAVDLETGDTCYFEDWGIVYKTNAKIIIE
jgi:hypothetical protein